MDNIRRQIEAEENLVIDFQYALIDALIERDMTRDDLANLMGVSKARVSQWLSDKSNPTLKTIARIFDALDMNFPCNPKSLWEAAKPARVVGDRTFHRERAFSPFNTVWIRDEMNPTNDNLSEREAFAA